MNHTIMMGPKTRPMRPVPEACTANSPIRMRTAAGTTKWWRLGAAADVPSTAAKTDIAGVIIPSP